MSHYLTLGVSETASPDEIKKAFRDLAKKYHPDTNQGDAKAEAKFRSINEAYETLKDPQKRAKYDAQRRNPFGRSDFRFEEQYRRKSTFDDIFAHMQNQHFHSAPRQKNRDTVLKYEITLEEAYSGKEVELKFSTSSRTTRSVKVNIPPSIAEGAKIRFSGQGDDSIVGVPSGDLYVVISIRENPNFVRIGYDIATTVYIDFIDAMLGVNKVVRSIDGADINLRIHAGLTPGSHVKVPERGFTKPNGIRGNMLVEVVMEQPKLSDAQLDHLTKIKSL